MFYHPEHISTIYFFLMALVHGPSKQPLPTRPSGRSLTFRLQNIPAHIDGGEVKAALAEGNVTNISQYSFARVDYEVACATVTFRSTPAAFQHAADGSYHTVPLQLSISRQELLLTVDTKFEGLTTLYHPEGQATVEWVYHRALHSIYESRQSLLNYRAVSLPLTVLEDIRLVLGRLQVGTMYGYAISSREMSQVRVS